MQSVIEQVKWVSALDQTAAQALVDDFVRCHLGPNFFACDPRWIEQNSTWSLFIECRVPNLARPILAGRVSVDGQTGQINGADEDALLNMQERVQIQVQRQFGQRLAYNADGLILPYQAMIKARVYVSDEIAFFVGAEDRPVLIDGTPPVWRVETALRLWWRKLVVPLGPVDVNAVTGEVIPLSHQELQRRRRQVEYVASPAQPEATSAG